ncbi:LysR family transcriptional regulator [Proteobacteria bacterium 005FR1]|nr:LysR family transcriptional regulator [Proteobacteria bacterium 005FR1]
MLDAVTLDQLRTFIAAAEEGSFSAAGRKLRRAQSVVSQTLANLESQLGVKLFDRSGRYPLLTEEGQALLPEARAVADDMDGFKARARALREGLEPELSVAVDVMYPMDALTCAAGLSREKFPYTPLRLYVEALGGVPQLVLEGTCRIGMMATIQLVPEELRAEPLGEVTLGTVVAPHHPLAQKPGPLTAEDVSEHVQLVLTDRTQLSAGRDFHVLSPQTWRLADLGAKHAFLKAGFGWGGMPLHMIERDLAEGALVRLRLATGIPYDVRLPITVVYRKDEPPGPAGRAFIDSLKQSHVADQSSASSP